MIGLLQDLVAIPSVNPAFSDGQGEQKIAQYIEQYFAACARSLWTHGLSTVPGQITLARIP